MNNPLCRDQADVAIPISASRPDSVICCRNLAKTFTETDIKIEVLRDITVTVVRGEQLAIMGASGAGKSTLLHLLGGLETATHGNVWVNGQELGSLSAAARAQIRNRYLGFIYQLHHLLPEFTALENTCIPLLIRGETPDRAKQRAMAVLDKVGLGARTYHKPAALSGGERQRAAVARALVTEPACVLADEPTGNLDHKTAQQVYDLMLELNRELQTSFIVVTHDRELASRMDRTLCLVDGVLQPC